MDQPNPGIAAISPEMARLQAQLRPQRKPIQIDQNIRTVGDGIVSAANSFLQGMNNQREERQSDRLLAGLKKHDDESRETFKGLQAGIAGTPPPAQPSVATTTPASIRNNNPGAMYPGPSATKFGSTGHQVIGGGHKIATFPDAQSGAAAKFDLLNRGYVNMPLSAAITKWSGGNQSPEYIARVARETGIRPDELITSEMLRDPVRGVALVRSMAGHEAGTAYPLSEDQWRSAQSRAFGQPSPGIATTRPLTTSSVAAAPPPATPSIANTSPPATAVPGATPAPTGVPGVMIAPPGGIAAVLPSQMMRPGVPSIRAPAQAAPPVRTQQMTPDQYNAGMAELLRRDPAARPGFERLNPQQQASLKAMHANQVEQYKLLAPKEGKTQVIGETLVRERPDGSFQEVFSAPKPTPEMSNYEAYVRQEQAAGRWPKSFNAWGLEWKRAAATTIDQRSESAEAKGRGEGLSKRLNKVAEDGIDAGNDLQLIQRLSQFNSAVNPGTRTALLQAINSRTGLGLGANASNVQAYQAMLDYLTPRMREAGSGASSDRDVRIFQGALPSLLGTPEGNALAIETLAGMATYRKAAADIAVQWQLGDISAKEANARMQQIPDPFMKFRSWAEANGQRPVTGAPGAQRQPELVRAPPAGKDRATLEREAQEALASGADPALVARQMEAWGISGRPQAVGGPSIPDPLPPGQRRRSMPIGVQ